MQLFENNIRSKCEAIYDYLEQIKKFGISRDAEFYFQQAKDTLTEIAYTSDEWFVGMNMEHDKKLQLIQRNRDLVKAVHGYEDILEEME